MDESSELIWLAAMGLALLLGFGAGYVERRRLRYALLAGMAANRPVRRKWPKT